jgi:hypothetical protein
MVARRYRFTGYSGHGFFRRIAHLRIGIDSFGVPAGFQQLVSVDDILDQPVPDDVFFGKLDKFNSRDRG